MNNSPVAPPPPPNEPPGYSGPMYWILFASNPNVPILAQPKQVWEVILVSGETVRVSSDQLQAGMPVNTGFQAEIVLSCHKILYHGLIQSSSVLYYNNDPEPNEVLKKYKFKKVVFPKDRRISWEAEEL